MGKLKTFKVSTAKSRIFSYWYIILTNWDVWTTFDSKHFATAKNSLGQSYDCTDIFAIFCICVRGCQGDKGDEKRLKLNVILGKKREVLGSTDLDTFLLTFRQYKPVGVGQAFGSIVPPAPLIHRAWNENLCSCWKAGRSVRSVHILR